MSGNRTPDIFPWILLADPDPKPYRKGFRPYFRGWRFTLEPDPQKAADFFFHHEVDLVLLGHRPSSPCLDLLNFFQTLKSILHSDSVLSVSLRQESISPDEPLPSPALTASLNEFRENPELRQNEPLVERANGLVTLRKPPLRVSCSYLVTAWPAVVGEELALQEHRLLSQALWVLSRYPSIPRNFLQGSIEGQDSLPMMTAQADGLKNPAELWTALGNRLKPSLTLTVTLAMEFLAPETFPMVITEEVRLGERTSPEEEKIKPSTLAGWFRIGGKVTGSDRQPVSGAVAALVEINRTAVTGGDGRFRIGPIPPGTYTLKVTKEASSVTRPVAVPAPAGNDYNVQLA